MRLAGAPTSSSNLITGRSQRQSIERVFDAGQPAFYEAVSAGPSGNSAWYETHVGTVKVGDQVVAVTLIATDITEKKQAEEALAERSSTSRSPGGCQPGLLCP